MLLQVTDDPEGGGDGRGHVGEPGVVGDPLEPVEAVVVELKDDPGTVHGLSPKKTDGIRPASTGRGTLSPGSGNVNPSRAGIGGGVMTRPFASVHYHALGQQEPTAGEGPVFRS